LQIWHVEIQVTGAVKVEFAADLQRHQRGVNVVKFSPSGEFLASADDGKLAFYILYYFHPAFFTV
jgi:WD40 repeat protein